jgi:Fe-S cluster biogenesis protein NfuA
MSQTDSAAELKERVRRILVEEVAPALHLDAAGIEVLDVSDGVVQVRLGDACASCPASLMTLIHGIEQELRRRLPQVEYLEAVP